VIVLPETGLAEACGIIERLRGKLESTVILYQDSAISITASFGVAEFVYGESFGDLLARADGMLYEAKQGGRNRVCPVS
jgi:diguanylate cyclase (GGDEF)-like protein